MGSMDSAFGGSSFEDGFEPDDFYESFLAPKFHDFTAPEEPIDPDAYFMTKPGMLKKAFATVKDVKPAAAKIQKEAPKTVALPKSPVAAEKTVASTGSAKESTRVIATSVTPLASKPQLKNSPMQEKHNINSANTANRSLKPTSLAKKMQASENDDPNSPTTTSPDVAAAASPKPAKQQRSIKAQEEKPAALTRQRSEKILETKPVLERKTSVESITSKEKAKTPVKEAAKAAVGAGHHCKFSRCAANDPHFASPVPTKKYLVAKMGTPGSLWKATTPETETNGVKMVKVALEDVFQKMALDPEVLSSSEVKRLKEVSLQEEEKAAISGDEIRKWVGRSVSFEEKKAVVSETTTEKSCTEETKGLETFLKVASECLENIDLETLAVPPISKQGKKRKSGELILAGASKRANCTSDETRNKAISKKISQVNQQAAAPSSKIPNKLRMRRLSVAKRLSIARAGSRVTNPRPFRLRTQERGVIKEKEFIKKVEEYKAAKEGFYSAFQGLAVAEPKIPAKFFKPGHVFVLNGQNYPNLRSTKKLTVPQEPKFHTARGSRNCPSHAVAV